MKFPIRAAAIAAILCTSTLIVAGTPGLALMLDKPLVVTSVPTKNVAVSNIVPADSTLSLPDFSDVPLPTTGPTSASDPEQALPEALSAAVAAQAAPGQMSDDLRCLASAVYYESKGEPLAGQLGVAHVILNRSRSGRFPSSVCGVVKQPGQFSFVRGGRMPSPGTGTQAYRTALAVARLALERQEQSPVASALYFHASYVSPKWGRSRVAKIGRHIFYR